MMITNQKTLRALFWAENPGLSRRRHRYSWSQADKTAPFVYSIDTRVCWVDFLDSLAKAGQISWTLADRAELDPKGGK